MSDSQTYKQKKYTDGTVLNCISKYFISLKDKDIKDNNQHLRKIVTDGLIPLMKEDVLFKDMYKNINYAGSFFKGTKVGKPDEYDLDLTIHLPLNYKTLQVETNHKHYGYVKIKVGADSKLPKWENHSKILNKWLDDRGYLDQNKFRQWMEKIMTKTYDQLKSVNNDFELTVDNKTYILKRYTKSGPAFTIYVKKLSNGSPDNRTMDVDIVPCLEFDDITLKGYKVVPNTSQKLIVVAKPIDVPEGNLLWRLSFYEQEKQILLQKEAGQLKPVIRLIKRFRDKQQWKKLASYYIETLFLHELIERQSDNDFFRAPQTCLFIHMLKKLCEAFQTRRINYFWHENLNLLSKMDAIVLDNYANRLNKILNDIDKNISENKFIIAEQILIALEVSRLKEIVITGVDPIAQEKAKEEVNNLNMEPKNDVANNISTDTTGTAKSINIECRVDQICNELSEVLKIQEELPQEQLEKLRNICMNFITPKKNE